MFGDENAFQKSKFQEKTGFRRRDGKTGFWSEAEWCVPQRGGKIGNPMGRDLRGNVQSGGRKHWEASTEPTSINSFNT